MESSNSHLVGVAVPTLRQLRAAILRSADAADAVEALREAGYAGGDSIHSAFEQWLAETAGTPSGNAGDLQLSEFGKKASTFFRDAGWGDVQFGHDDHEGVAIVDIVDCWEGSHAESAEDPGCQLTTGMLASFFGKIAGYPVAVLETECCHGESSRCRFLMGNAEMMTYKWQELLQAG
jgi:predicted hydrocarbon binding protein